MFLIAEPMKTGENLQDMVFLRMASTRTSCGTAVSLRKYSATCVVNVRECFQEFVPFFRHSFFEVLCNVFINNSAPEQVINTSCDTSAWNSPFDAIVVDCHLANEIYHSPKLFLGSDGNLDCSCGHSQFLAYLGDDSPWVSARPVFAQSLGIVMDYGAYLSIFIYEGEPWHIVSAHLTVDGNSLTLYSQRYS